jgi:hypothetical protein
MPAAADDTTTDTANGTDLSGLLGQLTDLGGAAANLYKAFGNQPAAAAAPAAAPASSTNWAKYLPWAIGGVVLLIVLGFVFKK